MAKEMNLARVNKKNPCVICNRPDWCMYSERFALCMRVPSERPKLLRSGDTGYWHPIKDTQVRVVPPKPVRHSPEIDCEGMMQRWRSKTSPSQLSAFAADLGVKASALLELGAVWVSEYKAWAFGMYDGNARMVGIRLRSMDGNKFAVTGSKQGVFLPSREPDKIVYLCEGPTDCAALLSMNLFAIGRPSCSGGFMEINSIIKKLGIKEAIIIADNDQDKETPAGAKFNPGYDGAASLARVLTIRRCVMSVPTKDVRDFYINGGNAQLLESIGKNLCWEKSV